MSCGVYSKGCADQQQGDVVSAVRMGGCKVALDDVRLPNSALGPCFNALTWAIMRNKV